MSHLDVYNLIVSIRTDINVSSLYKSLPKDK